MTPRSVLALVVAVAAAISAVLASTGAGTAPAGAATLKQFSGCGDFLGYARAHARREVLPTLSLQRHVEARLEESAPAPTGGPVDDTEAQGEEETSGTNVQVPGIDEPDLVKTDGKRLFVVARGKLRSFDPTGPQPRPLQSLPLAESPDPKELLLRGNRLIVLGNEGGRVLLTEVDVSDPAGMRIVRQVSVDGSYLTARLTGRTARVIVHSTPDVLVEAFGEERALRRKVARARTSQWLPTVTVRQGRQKRRSVVPCAGVRRPRQFSGLESVTVLTLDLDRGIDPVDTDTVLTDADIVYASGSALYLASQRWERTTSTELHKFDATAPDRTEHVASGRVSGSLLNQFSLDEHAGFLRVATTDQPEDEDSDSESSVTVLGQTGRELLPVGRAGGLGKGEQIHSVRFIGDRGYVVTFRQTDPLYTLDLSVPTAPRVTGELKILGYSAYLHPIGEHLLLGIGQDATSRGEALGTQLSLFDVSNPAAPQRLHQRRVGASASEAEADHRAFLYWPMTRTAVLPYANPDGSEFSSGAMGFSVDAATGIRRIGAITHDSSDPADAQIRRSLVIGDRLLTISESGLGVSPLGPTIARAGYVPFD